MLSFHTGIHWLLVVVSLQIYLALLIIFMMLNKLVQWPEHVWYSSYCIIVTQDVVVFMWDDTVNEGLLAHHEICNPLGAL